MPELWIPGASRVVSRGGSMEGPTHIRACVLHTSESDTGASPASIARYVISRGSEYHLIWNPYSGDMCQIMPATDSARSLRNAGSVRTNRVGSIRIQVCVIGRAASRPLDTSPLKNWERIRDWVRSWGVPDTDIRSASRSMTVWTSKSGWTTHASAPGNDHTDPGGYDFARLFATGPTVEEAPDMLIIRQGTKSPILIHGASTTVIDEKSAQSMEKSGVPACKVTSDVYQRFKAQ